MAGTKAVQSPKMLDLAKIHYTGDTFIIGKRELDDIELPLISRTRNDRWGTSRCLLLMQTEIDVPLCEQLLHVQGILSFDLSVSLLHDRASQILRR